MVKLKIPKQSCPLVKHLFCGTVDVLRPLWATVKPLCQNKSMLVGTLKYAELGRKKTQGPDPDACHLLEQQENQAPCYLMASGNFWSTVSKGWSAGRHTASLRVLRLQTAKVSHRSQSQCQTAQQGDSRWLCAWFFI